MALNQTDHEDEDDSTYEENTIGNATWALLDTGLGHLVTFMGEKKLNHLHTCECESSCTIT